MRILIKLLCKFLNFRNLISLSFQLLDTSKHWRKPWRTLFNIWKVFEFFKEFSQKFRRRCLIKVLKRESLWDSMKKKHIFSHENWNFLEPPSINSSNIENWKLRKVFQDFSFHPFPPHSRSKFYLVLLFMQWRKKTLKPQGVCNFICHYKTFFPLQNLETNFLWEKKSSQGKVRREMEPEDKKFTLRIEKLKF